MHNPKGSDIPSARKKLEEARDYASGRTRQLIIEALELMKRSAPVRCRTRRVKKEITEAMIADIKSLAGDDTVTNSEIAQLVGLEASDAGRVSEVIAGLR